MLISELRDKQQRLYTLLDDGYTWLNTHEGHRKHAENEAIWFQAEEDYRAICDALNDALDIWLGDGEAVA